MASVQSDDQILNSIFNPELPFQQLTSSEKLATAAKSYAKAQEDTFDKDKLTQYKLLQNDAIDLTNQKSYESALTVITTAIDLLPRNPAGYNDRAQILRILRRDNDATADLNRAIDLSNGLGTVAAQAFTQRALMKKYAGETESAAEDFQAAAKLGSMFARQEAVKLNPYAALCNSMLKRMMSEVSTGKSCDTGANKCG